MAGILKVRNCTIWDVHYWKVTGKLKNLVVGPGEEGIYEGTGLTYTLGVNRPDLPKKNNGQHYREGVNPNGTYYVVWRADKQELDILNEHSADLRELTPDNEHLSKWIKRFPDWMSALNGTHTLDKYSIPGTHDSGTKNTGHGDAHTQNFGIFAQLADGIRFLDIRLDGVTDLDHKLVVKHGAILCFLSFEDVLNDCRKFLNEHKREIIIMMVGHSNSGSLFDIGPRFKYYLDKKGYSDLFYLGDKMPRLDDVRGKIVLFRRFKIDYPGPMGINLSNGWGGSETFSLTTQQGQQFKIEDQYSEHNTHKKLSEVEKSLNSALTKPNDGIMYITYNSISGGHGHTPYQYAWGGSGVHPIMNTSLELFLRARSGNQRFGVVMLDFYNDKGSQNGNVEIIVKSNDGLKG